MAYVIQFTFPEGDTPRAVLVGDAWGFGQVGHIFDERSEAERVLRYAYGPTSRPYGKVIAVDDH